MGTRISLDAVEETTIETADLSFKALTMGDGNRYAVLFHGFPDDPGSMIPLMEILAEHGFTAIAPYMRGYGKTERPPLSPDNYTPMKLGSDVAAVLAALDADDAVVVGHDWGALAVTTVSMLGPPTIAECVTMSVPPDFMTALETHATQALRSWYMTLFQIPGVAEEVVRRNDFALIERLWNMWSPNWDYSDERLAAVKDTLSTGKTVEAALLYYRGMFDEFLTKRQDKLTIAGIEIPTLLVTGADDGCISPDLYEESHQCYEGRFTFERVTDAGHFVHVERPKAVGERIIEFIDEA
jgi:pimeloyl-ACP methyl ester carboxylesterase